MCSHVYVCECVCGYVCVWVCVCVGVCVCHIDTDRHTYTHTRGAAGEKERREGKRTAKAMEGAYS